MMKRPVGAMITARVGSGRVPKKLIRAFGDTTLFEIALSKLAALESLDRRIVAIGEEPLVSIARGFPELEIVLRTPESFTGDPPARGQFNFMEELSIEHWCWVNTCFAFLRPKTIDEAVELFAIKGMASLTSVVKTRDWLYDSEGRAISNRDTQVISTKSSPIFYRVAHAFHIISKTVVLQENSFWHNEPNDPYLYPIEPWEAIDVDYEWEFTMAEAVYRSGAFQSF